jgi:hypothetical protein
MKNSEYEKIVNSVKILCEHNAWRKGDDNLKMAEPKELTDAINIVCDNYKYLIACNFFERLKSFIANVEVNDLLGEEEKQMIINVCEHFRKK